MPTTAGRHTPRSHRAVSTLLSTLRDEHRRHLSNISKNTDKYRQCLAYTSAATPINLIQHEYPSDDTANFIDTENPNNLGPQARRPAETLRQRLPTGAPPHRSWVASTVGACIDTIDTQTHHQTRTFRLKALELFFANDFATKDASDHSSSQSFEWGHSLSSICFHVLRTSYSPDELARDILPCLSPYIRRAFMRDSAVEAPLSTQLLAALCDDIWPDGKEVARDTTAVHDDNPRAPHVDGELIVVGPAAHFKDVLVASFPASAAFSEDSSSWDDGDDATDRTAAADWLQSLAIVSARASPLSRIPSTLTRLALVNLPEEIKIHRLPTLCPLLVLLDLSFNSWLRGTTVPIEPRLSAPASERKSATQIVSPGILERVPWERWVDLRVLGLREVFLPAGFADQVNKERWEDVAIIES
ncbi:hypothetical protein FISHEDRAFT_78452 [Fistulina hepatica ATCC 64428]|nr:hypothetical protein FISHEDRAFT_78452 [Fistulina hepatica ATCC 64428]